MFAGLCVALAASAPAAGGADRCRGQDTPIAAANLIAAERTLLCLVNVHRAASAVKPVFFNGSLRKAARAHSADLVQRDFWNARNPDGDGPHERAEAAGYPETSTVGESFVTDPNASPNTLFSALVAYPTHNTNLLSTAWQALGTGLALGTPPHKMLGEGGATGTLLFGNRRGGRGSTDTAVDLLVTEECAPARADRSAAAKQVRLDRNALEQAETETERRAARRQLRQSLAALETAVAEVKRACHPTSY
jgi:hypothetical protein